MSLIEACRMLDSRDLMSNLDFLNRDFVERIVELPPDPLIKNIENNFASEFYNRLAKMISDFDEALDQKHEVGLRLVSFGQTVIFHLEGMGYYNPSLISFAGHTEEGNPVELIHHISQISILLMKLPRQNPSEPKKPIGFLAEAERDTGCNSAE